MENAYTIAIVEPMYKTPANKLDRSVNVAFGGLTKGIIDLAHGVVAGLQVSAPDQTLFSPGSHRRFSGSLIWGSFVQAN
jgi:hypothetical protein